MDRRNLLALALVMGYQKRHDRARLLPFASCVTKRRPDNALLLGQGGEQYYLFGLNILGVGVLIDSLYTIKKLVFEQKYTTLAHLREQTQKNFDD